MLWNLKAEKKVFLFLWFVTFYGFHFMFGAYFIQYFVFYLFIIIEDYRWRNVNNSLYRRLYIRSRICKNSNSLYDCCLQFYGRTYKFVFFCATENTHKLRDEVNRDTNNEIQNILEQKTPHCKKIYCIEWVAFLATILVLFSLLCAFFFSSFRFMLFYFFSIFHSHKWKIAQLLSCYINNKFHYFFFGSVHSKVKKKWIQINFKWIISTFFCVCSLHVCVPK